MNKRQIKKMKAVMMEYVLIAVLIAAAVVGAVMMFGKTIFNSTNVATSAVADPGYNQSTVTQGVQDGRSLKKNAKISADKNLKAVHGDVDKSDDRKKVKD